MFYLITLVLSILAVVIFIIHCKRNYYHLKAINPDAHDSYRIYQKEKINIKIWLIGLCVLGCLIPYFNIVVGGIFLIIWIVINLDTAMCDQQTMKMFENYEYDEEKQKVKRVNTYNEEHLNCGDYCGMKTYRNSKCLTRKIFNASF